MSDRGFLFLFSVLMIVAGAAAVAYLAATGQVATMDGLFLTLTALLLAAGFAIYLIRRALETAKPAAQTPQAAAGAAAKPAPVKG